MYRYLKLDPTFKQTKRVLGTLRKLPGPESMSRFILADKYVKYFYFIRKSTFNLIHELKLKWKYKGNNSVTLVNMLFRHKMNDDVIQNKAVYALSEFILH